MKYERKPRILMVGDVKGWAWDNKTKELQKHLSDEFELIYFPILEEKRRIDDSFDIYFTYGWGVVHSIEGVPFERRVSGVTAHKKRDFFLNTIVPTMKRVRWHHANSILLLDEMKSAGFKETFYVPNGVNPEQFKIVVPIPENRDNLVVGHVGKHCGSGTDAKGHKRFIEPACQKAKVIYRHIYNNYKNRIPHENMPGFYQEIDCFIVSSETDGTPNGALEAAACGRPVLSNRIGNMPEFIKDNYNGFLVDRDVDKYVEKILFWKENRKALIQMGINARREIEKNWTWKKMSENYAKMFNHILDEVGLRKL